MQWLSLLINNFNIIVISINNWFDVLDFPRSSIGWLNIDP